MELWICRFLDNVDENKVSELLSNVDKNVKYFNDITDKVTKSYTEHLDKLMKTFYLDHRKLKDYSTDELERLYLDLTNLLYFIFWKEVKYG